MADKTVVTSAFWGKEQNTNVTISVLQPESKSVLGIDQPLADQKIVRYRYTERRQDRCRYLFRLKNKQLIYGTPPLITLFLFVQRYLLTVFSLGKLLQSILVLPQGTIMVFFRL